MANTVRITTDNKIKLLDIPWDFDSWEQAIGAGCTEIVRTDFLYRTFKDKIIMIVDESGAAKRREVNQVASYLYGSWLHGNCIYGDVLFAKQSGLDTVPLENPEQILSFLKSQFGILEEE